MKKFFIFILCVCVLLFSVPFASAATDHYQTFSHYDIPDPCLYYYQTSNASSYATITGVTTDRYKQWSYVTLVNSVIAFNSVVSARPLAITFGNPMQISCDYFYLNSNGFNYMIICSDNFASGISQFLTTSQGDVKVQEYLDILLDPTCRETDGFLFGVKYQTTSSTSSSPVCNYTVPSGYNGNLHIFFISVLPGARSGNTYMQRIGDIYVDPIGSSIPLFSEQQYRDDVIGSDEDGHESGLAGIFKKIKQLPGQISGFVSGLGDRLLGSDEEGSESGLKGILKKIKDLPETLANKIKGLFIPDDDFFEDYKSQFIQLFEDHLGVLYQAPEMVISVIRELVAFDPVTGLLPQNYDIKFPAKSFYIEVDSAAEENQFDISEDPFTDDDSEFILLPDNGDDGFYHVDLSFLASNPYSTLYSIFRAVTTVVLIISIIYFCIYKFNEILRGAPSGDN